MECNYCQQVCLKKGFQKNGKQKYYCKNCHHYQQKSYTYNAYHIFLNQDIINMVKRSCGIRDIAYIKKISSTTVIKKIRYIARALRAPVYFPLFSEYEMDEMHTHIWNNNKKQDTYIAYAMNKENKSVINFTVGGRDALTLNQTVSKILLNYPIKIRTDKWPSYPCIIPKKIHDTRKRKINQVERNNYTMRTQLKRLGYNPICQSKKKDMLEACLKIYFWG